MSARTHIPAFLAVGLLALVPVINLPAQDAAETWTVRVAALDIAGGHDTLWLRTGAEKEAIKVQLNTRVFSEAIEFKGDSKIEFFTTAAEAAAEIPPLPLATAHLMDPSSLLLFAPKADEVGYRVFLIADERFPFGSFRFVNLSKSNVHVELDDKSSMLEPGTTRTVSFSNAKLNIPVRVRTLGQESSEPRLVRQSSWSIVPTQRELVLIVPNEHHDSVRLRHFVDSMEEKPDE